MPFKENLKRVLARETKQANALAASSEERERARSASLKCPFCNGAGVVTVYHPTFTGNSTGITRDGRQYVATCMAHCRCELGTWHRERTPDDLQALIPRVEDCCTRRSMWLLEPPGFEEPYPSGPVDRTAFDRLRAKISSARMLSPVPRGTARRLWHQETDRRARALPDERDFAP
jgi:hypothetical protein